ncbi:unnamed protein product, partial [Closterium sp. NIES-53]
LLCFASSLEWSCDHCLLLLSPSSPMGWLTCDATPRLAIRNHLPLAECAHFGQHRTAQALFDAVVARYSSLATAALGCLLLPYMFLDLSALATAEDLVSYLRTSDARYRATLLHCSLPRTHPRSLTIDLLEQHLLAAETSVVAVGSARGTPRTPFFEGCPPSTLAPSYASSAAADVPGATDVGAASASANCRSGKGKGGRGSGGGSGGGGGGSSGGGGGNGGGASGGNGGGSGGFRGGGGGSVGSGCSGSGGSGGGRTGAPHGDSGGGQRQQQQRRSKTQSPQQLREWFAQRGASGGSVSCLTTLNPLSALVPVRLADPSGGPVLARSSTDLPCPAVPSGSLSGLHLPSFSTKFVSTAALQDAMVTTTTPGGVRVRSSSTPLFISPPVAPPPWSPLLATPSWHALPPPCLWSSQVSASPPALACPALPSLRQGAVARRSSLLLVSPDDCSPADSPHGLLQEVGGELTTSVRVQTQDKKVLAETLTELETDCADPRDQDINDLTLAAQGEDRGVPRVVLNHQQKVALAALSTDAGWARYVHVESLEGSCRWGKQGGVRSGAR